MRGNRELKCLPGDSRPKDAGAVLETAKSAQKLLSARQRPAGAGTKAWPFRVVPRSMESVPGK